MSVDAGLITDLITSSSLAAVPLCAWTRRSGRSRDLSVEHDESLRNRRSHSTEGQVMVALSAVKTLSPDSSTYDP